jgi:enoyl-CoA hydratase/carnithine racemase
LVTEVVDHEHLLARAIAIGTDMAGTDPEVAAALLDLYDQTSAGTLDEAWAAEAAAFRDWWNIRMVGGNVPDAPAEVIDRGRNQMRR